MVQPASAKLTTLPTRPPTPPRESSSSADIKNHFLSGIFPSESPRASLTSTPNSSAEVPTILPGSTRKKVDFSPRVETKDPPKLSADGRATPQSRLQPLPPSATRKPSKSILKPYNGNFDLDLGLGFNTKLSPAHTFPNLATMLESITQQLAGKDRTSKLDAYMALSGALKAADNVPDIRALKAKMGLLEQFMQRDISAKNISGGPDTALAVQALVLLGSCLYKPSIAEMFSTDFSTFVVEHTSRTLEGPQMSKEIVKHLMFIMSKQSFSHKVLNSERVAKLIRAVHNVENYVTGKSISTGRIGVYRNLLRVAPSLMIANTDWVEDLFDFMSSGTKEVRNPGIQFGQEAASLFGTEPRVSRQVAEVLSRGADAGPKLVEVLSRKMKLMVEKRQDAVCVPQIWTVVVLFLRAKPHQLEQWSFLQLWLQTLQPCFNGSEQNLKAEANLAWSRFIYATQPDEKTTLNFIKTLSMPIIGQIRRRSSTKSINSKRSRHAINSLCALLYYTFKPHSTASRLDLFWDLCVVPVMAELTPAAGSGTRESTDLDLACAILTGLFNLSTPRSWDEKRALLSEPIKTNELPALDSKWVRRNSERIFGVLAPLLERRFWQISEDQSPINILWMAYLKSIAAPAAKEIKVSLDTMGCIASLFGMLYKFWHSGPAGLQTLSIGGTPEFLAGFAYIIRTAIAELGTLPFTERLLSFGQQDTFVVIATPSHRPDKVRGIVKCPLHHLFVLFTDPSPGLQYDGSCLKVIEGFVPLNFRQVIGAMLHPFVEARNSNQSRIDLLGDLIQLLPIQISEQNGMIWRALAEFATLAIDSQDDSSSSSSSSYGRPLGAEYRQITSILEIGIEISPSVAMPGWKILFEALVTRVTIESGDSGRAIAIVEPLAKALLPRLASIQDSTCGISYCQMLVAKTTFPKDRPALDAARRRLWGTVNIGPKTITFDPYSHLYDYVGLCLEKSYAAFTEGATSYANLLSAVSELLHRCPATLFPKTVSRLQKGAASWILDPYLQLNGRQFSEISRAVASFWSTTCSRITSIANDIGYSNLLGHMELLICSGLDSKHRSVVNTAIETWNATFGASREELDYPQGLLKSLQKLRVVADLNLPNFPDNLVMEEEVDEDQLDLPSFPETQNSSFSFSGGNSLESFLTRQRTPQLMISSPVRQIRSTPRILDSMSKSTSQKRIRNGTPDTSTRTSSRRSTTPRMRHDDSQIHFAPIESSPIGEPVMESQPLTDRQREVKERQAEAALMFPDLKSSPRRRGKSTPKAASNIESLPIQLPTSSKRDQAVQRPSTPTIYPNTMFDDNITSSPTPARSLRNDQCLSQPASSSLESPTEEQAPDYLFTDDDDIPSSPPVNPLSGREASLELGADTTLSIDPSAQIDPYAVVHPSKLSTYQNADDANSDENNPSRDVIGGTTSPKSPTVQITRDVFFHAMSSPASSDKHTVDEDVFLDAVTSPLENAKTQEQAVHRTSSLSDLDESSMMRLMNEYDEESDGSQKAPGERDAQGALSSSSTSHKHKEELNAPHLMPSSTSESIVITIPNGYKMPDGPRRRISVRESIRTRRSASVLSQQSSILETPDVNPGAVKQTSPEAKLSPNLRVVINVPATRSSTRRAASTRLSEAHTLVQSKRKYDETEQDSEVPDSQEASFNGRLWQSAPFKIDAHRVIASNTENPPPSTVKRRRGRSSTVLSQQQLDNPSAPTSASENMDHDASVHSSWQENIDSKDDEGSKQTADHPSPAHATKSDSESLFVDDAIAGNNETATSSPEEFASRPARSETRGREGSDNEKESANDAETRSFDLLDVHSGEEMSSSSSEPAVGADEDTEMEDAPAAKPTVEGPQPVARGLVARLESIVSDLGRAALSKEAFEKLDYLLWNAKGKIGLARARGEDEGI
ncbi:Telomere length regulator protein rif1 [Phlyctema vagabunda]|uniref:Telomere length regulator protein rif1 n=1 Tax=Phlyctema vagabunda TaxID=108571 RepID=A0ABR4PQG4_9HELO